MTIRSQFARHVPVEPLDRDGLRAKARKLWLERGVVMIWPDDVRDSILRQAVESAATVVYGKRTANGG